MSEYSIYFNDPGTDQYPRTFSDMVKYVADSAIIERQDAQDIYVKGEYIPDFQYNDRLWIHTPNASPTAGTTVTIPTPAPLVKKEFIYTCNSADGLITKRSFSTGAKDNSFSSSWLEDLGATIVIDLVFDSKKRLYALVSLPDATTPEMNLNRLYRFNEDGSRDIAYTPIEFMPSVYEQVDGVNVYNTGIASITTNGLDRLLCVPTLRSDVNASVFPVDIALAKTGTVNGEDVYAAFSINFDGSNLQNYGPFWRLSQSETDYNFAIKVGSATMFRDGTVFLGQIYPAGEAPTMQMDNPSNTLSYNVLVGPDESSEVDIVVNKKSNDPDWQYTGPIAGPSNVTFSVCPVLHYFSVSSDPTSYYITSKFNLSSPGMYESYFQYGFSGSSGNLILLNKIDSSGQTMFSSDVTALESTNGYTDNKKIIATDNGGCLLSGTLKISKFNVAGLVDENFIASGIKMLLVLTPSLSCPSYIEGYQGIPFSLQLSGASCTGELSFYQVDGLPSTIGLASSTGLISGTPDRPGVYNLTVTSTNAFGATTQGLVLRVYPANSTANFSIPSVRKRHENAWKPFGVVRRGDLVLVPSSQAITFPWGESKQVYDMSIWGEGLFQVPVLPSAPSGFKYKYYIGVQNFTEPSPPIVVP